MTLNFSLASKIERVGTMPIACLQAMQVFVKVAECGDFAEAQRQLSMSAPAVTRAVALLGESLGAHYLWFTGLFRPAWRAFRPL